MKPVLTICKPSYNRKDVLIPDIKEYLSIKDDRLQVKVSDNASTDGTVEELLNIKDPRLILNLNKENVGPRPNCLSALKGTGSDYILLVIDKDTVDVKLLPKFIDFLQNERPFFGFIDLSNKKQMYEKTYAKGYECISNLAYLSKHPSGYFWRSDLFEEEIEKTYFKNIKSDFDFPYEVINGSLGASYDGVIVYWPFIINETLRINELEMPKTKSYNADNFFFGKKMRLVAYNYYYSNMLSLPLQLEDKIKLARTITNTAISGVTVGLRRLLQRKNVCYHYNLTKRNVGLYEMIRNTLDVLKIFKFLSSKSLPKSFVFKEEVLLFIKS